MVSGVVLVGPRPLKSLKKHGFSLVFHGFLHFRFVRLCWLSGFILGAFGSLCNAFSLHFRSKLASWATFCLQSRPPGGAFGLQVGVLGDLWASKLASLFAWISEVPSWVSFGRPSWPPRSDFDLQVGLLSSLLASKLASWSGFGPPRWRPGPSL